MRTLATCRSVAGPLRPRSALLALGASLAIGLNGIAGCRNIEPVAPYAGPISDPDKLYMRLAFDEPAVTLSTGAPYNIAHLTAIPRDAQGQPMLGLPAPTYHSSDTARVQVDSAGVVTAIQPGTGVFVVALLTVGPVTHADTTIVDVTSLATPPRLASLSIHPVPPDSTVVAADGGWPSVSNGPSRIVLEYVGIMPNSLGTLGFVLNARLTDSLGANFNVRTFYESLDPSVISVTREGFMQKNNVGQVKLVAKTMAYGIAKADTVTYTITLPIDQDIRIVPGSSGPVLQPSEVRIAPYGFVFWYNAFNDSTQQITFDDPAQAMMPPDFLCTAMPDLQFNILTIAPHCGAGDISLPGNPAVAEPDLWYFDLVQVRQFRTPGIYPFHAPGGVSGRVVVATSPN